MNENHEDQPQIQLPLEEDFVEMYKELEVKKEVEEKRGVEIIELLKND